VEKDFIRDVIYRQEFLDIFKFEEYNDDSITNAAKNLYQKIQSCTFMRECMKEAAKGFLNEDEVFGLIILYSFDYMYLTHVCVSEYLTTGSISREKSARLMAAICKNTSF
jgi:hypothetical protein